MTKHTSGPWEAYKNEITKDKTVLIAEFSNDVTVKKSEAEANAKLAAAAPDLLAALEAMRYAIDRQLSMTGKGITPSPRLQEAFAQADAAIAKAT